MILIQQSTSPWGFVRLGWLVPDYWDIVNIVNAATIEDINSPIGFMGPGVPVLRTVYKGFIAGGIGIGSRPGIKALNRANRSTTHNPASTRSTSSRVLEEVLKHPPNGMARSYRIAGDQRRESIYDISEPIFHLLLSSLTVLPLLGKAPSYDNPQFVLSLRPDVQYPPNMIR
jgi:hypothetical protein